MNDESIQYELPTGAIVLLHKILTLASWYKDEPKQAKVMIAAMDAIDRLPPEPPELPRTDGEKDDAYASRFREWEMAPLMFQWDDRHKDAAKVCVRYFIKQGNLTTTRPVCALVRMLQLDKE
jgi:hypothetical protein